MTTPPSLVLLTSPDWEDYQLLDSGNSAKLERYGAYTFVRPEHQAIWRPVLPETAWKAVHAVYETGGDVGSGQWHFIKVVPSTWEMRYKGLRFMAQASTSRHMGVFPEQAAHWDWIDLQIRQAIAQGWGEHPPRVLSLFGYTGIASLAAARAGASVTHIDASRKALQQARANQELSGLGDRPIRWLVDDVFKFVSREVRRGSKYDGIILDPPKFGRGPKGQVWELFESLPGLLGECRKLLSQRPIFILLNAYAIRASALSVFYALQEMVTDLGGRVETGELVLVENRHNLEKPGLVELESIVNLISKTPIRMLSMAIFARWSSYEIEDR